VAGGHLGLKFGGINDMFACERGCVMENGDVRAYCGLENKDAEPLPLRLKVAKVKRRINKI
jgi:hypothetical protein